VGIRVLPCRFVFDAASVPSNCPDDVTLLNLILQESHLAGTNLYERTANVQRTCTELWAQWGFLTLVRFGDICSVFINHVGLLEPALSLVGQPDYCSEHCLRAVGCRKFPTNLVCGVHQDCAHYVTIRADSLERSRVFLDVLG
jgi:hypothetical protein